MPHNPYHRGFDPTIPLPDDTWTSFQGVPHSYPQPEGPLELTAYYGQPEDSSTEFMDSLSSMDPYSTEGLRTQFRSGDEFDQPTLWGSIRRFLEPQTGGETAALVGASFAPGLGEAIDVADFVAGVQDRDPVRMGFASAGLLLPFVAGSTLRKIGSKAPSKAEPDVVTETLEGVEELEDFRAADRVEDTVVRPRSNEGIEGIPTAGVRGQGKGFKSVRELPLEEAVRQARNRAHLVRKADGGYVGAPAWIRSPQALAKLRRQLDELAEQGAMGRDWYDRTEAGNRAIAGPHADRTARLSAEEGLWSAQATPDVNFGHALKGHNAYELGTPLEKVRTGRQARVYNEAMDAGELPGLGPKTGVYGEHLDPFVESPITGTNDIWHSRAFGYTEGESISAQVHAFMDAETLLAAERLNAKHGTDIWDGRGIQAAIWVRMKGADLAEKRFKGDLARGIEEAQKTYPDFFQKYGVNATHEAVPGRGTGHLPDLLDESWEAREAYTDAVPWTTRSGQDVMYDEVGMYNEPIRPATGYYMGETNPVRVSRPMAPRVGGKSAATKAHIDPLSREAISATEAVRGLLDAQNAAAWHRPVVDMMAGQQKSAFSLLNDAVDPDLLDEAAQMVPTHYPIDTGRGVTWLPIKADDLTSQEVLRSTTSGPIYQAGARLGSPGTARVGADSDYIKILEDIGEAQGTGRATQRVLDRVDQAVEAGATNLPSRLSSEPIRRRAAGLLARDEALAARLGGVRPDIQNFRRLFAEGGLPAVRAALARGDVALPAVGLLAGYGALGYDRSSRRAQSR